jgi:hypothetical protein
VEHYLATHPDVPANNLLVRVALESVVPGTESAWRAALTARGGASNVARRPPPRRPSNPARAPASNAEGPNAPGQASPQSQATASNRTGPGGAQHAPPRTGPALITALERGAEEQVQPVEWYAARQLDDPAEIREFVQHYFATYPDVAAERLSFALHPGHIWGPPERQAAWRDALAAHGLTSSVTARRSRWEAWRHRRLIQGNRMRRGDAQQRPPQTGRELIADIRRESVESRMQYDQYALRYLTHPTEIREFVRNYFDFTGFAAHNNVTYALQRRVVARGTAPLWREVLAEETAIYLAERRRSGPRRSAP